MTELPRWQSHKKVWGDKVVAVEKAGFGPQRITDDTFKDWVLANGAKVPVSFELNHRGGRDPVGGYYVLYEDGFESWSPAEAFEKGYTRIEDGE